MLRVFDFRCTDGHVTEHFVTDDMQSTLCHCGRAATRQLAAPPCKLEGYSGSFPGRAMKWERDHEQAAKKSDVNQRD